MVHGAPDNFEVQQKVTTFRLDDMAELAVRLGAVNSADRLGDVYFFDNFANGLGNWETIPAGTGSGISSSGSIFKHKSWSCKLIGGSALGNYAYITSRQSYSQPSKMGLEVNFSVNNNVEAIT
ncbi:unnamed protein product, partial [marine sediment metagenome]